MCGSPCVTRGESSACRQRSKPRQIQGPPSALVTLLVSTLTFDLPAWLGWPHPAGDTSEMANGPRGSDGLGGKRHPHDAVVSVSITCTAHPLGCLTGPQRSDGICDIIARACRFPSRISPTRSHSDLFRSWDRCSFCEVMNFFFIAHCVLIKSALLMETFSF